MKLEISEFTNGVQITETKTTVEVSMGAPVPGVGVPAGGSSGQVLAKASAVDYDTQWITGGGGGGTPSDTVASETAYSQSSSAGVATTYSRGDHTHGTPPPPTWDQVSGKPSTFPPTAHATSHGSGGSDAVTIAESQVTNLVTDLGNKANLTDSRFPTSDEKAALAGTNGAPGATNKYVTNSDPRNADARTPTAHASSHGSGGSDAITIAESQVTNLVSDLASKLTNPMTTRGDMIRQGASGAERIPLGKPGSWLKSDGTDMLVVDPSLRAYYFDDWISGTISGQTDWSSNTGGGAIAIAPWLADNRPGVVRLSNGTTASTITSVIKLIGIPLIGGKTLFRALVMIPTLSDATDTFVDRIGFGSSYNAEPSDGIYFVYSHNINLGKWRAINRVASVDNVIDSNITVTAGTWYLLEGFSAADGNSASFAINGTSIGTSNVAVATNTTMYHIIQHFKTAGTGTRYLYVDFYEFEKIFNTARF